jgi:nucleoside-diphosphate-sugar epimerase
MIEQRNSVQSAFVSFVRARREILARMAADMALINLAMAIALVTRYIYVTAFEASDPSQLPNFWQYVSAYAASVLFFMPLALVMLFAQGVYTHARSYRRRRKVVIVARSVSVSVLTFGFISYLLPNWFYLPRGALVLAWLLVTVLLVGARMWSWLWRIWAGYAANMNGDIADRAIFRVLVVGGAGYIGSEVVRLLLKQGHTVRILDRLLYGTEPIADMVGDPRLEIVQEDFRKIDAVVEAMQSVDAVVHLGAIVGDPACALDEGLTIQVNLTATRMIAEVAKGVGVNRFVFASTCSVYGASDEILDENSSLNPVSLYAKSKIACERVLRSMADHRFAPVILRFGTIYGLSGRTRFDLVANLMTATAAFEGKIYVQGGDQWRPFIHVADAARAAVECLRAPLPAVRNRAFNVGSDEQNYTLRDLAQIVARQVPSATVVEQSTNADRRNYRVNFSAIRDAIGFSPRWTLESGIRQVADAIGRGEVKDYKSPAFSNVRFLSEEGLSRLGKTSANWEQELLDRSQTPVELSPKATR